MTPLRAFIARFTALRPEDWEQIAPHWEEVQLSPGQSLLEPGQVCRHLYFLEEGLIRFYYVHDGEERNRYFLHEAYVFTEQTSFRQEIPSTEGIAAISAARVLRMSRAQAYALLALPAWNTFVRELVQELQSLTEQQMTEMMTMTAEARYRRMLEEESALMRQLPLVHLASYLGIAPPSLSRIRKKIMQDARTSPR